MTAAHEPFAVVPRSLIGLACEAYPAGFAVLVALLTYACNGAGAWPSVSTLARLTCRKRDAVRRALAAYQRAGLIDRDVRPGRTSLYRLGSLTGSTDATGSKNATGSTDAGGGGSTDATPPVASVRHDPTKDPTSDPTRCSEAGASGARGRRTGTRGGTWLTPYLTAYVEALRSAFPDSRAAVEEIAREDSAALARHLGGRDKSPAVEVFADDLRRWAASLSTNDGLRGYVRLRDLVAWSQRARLTGGKPPATAKPTGAYSDDVWKNRRGGEVRL